MFPPLVSALGVSNRLNVPPLQILLSSDRLSALSLYNVVGQKGVRVQFGDFAGVLLI